MPRLVHRNPKYRKHKASGQAIVTLNGHDVYLGPHGTQASHNEYDRILAEWLANGRQSPAALATGGIYLVRLATLYTEHAATYYARSKGELAAVRSALAVLLSLYATTRAADFGPLSLRAVREAMVRKGWNRNYVNQQVVRIRQMFKFAVERELVPASVLVGLQTVRGLKRGKSEAPEPKKVTVVADEHVDATLPYLSRHVRAMIEMQRLTGMRPGEVCAMRSGDVQAISETVWEYRPAAHKTDHHGHDRVIYLGPRAVELLSRLDQHGRRWLRPDLDAFLFQPAEAEAERLAAVHAARTTPLPRGNRPGTNRRRNPKTRPGDHYEVDAYRRAITRACEIAFGMPASLRKGPKNETVEQKLARLAGAKAWRAKHCWHPHQLRHTVGTNIRRDFDLDAAKTILGHATIKAAEVYAEQDRKKAMKIMAEVG